MRTSTLRCGLTSLGPALVLLVSNSASALPIAPDVFCETYEGEISCIGQVPACTLCHVTTEPAKMNVFGSEVEVALAEIVPGPYGAKAEAFREALPAALAAVEDLDSDGDGYSNLGEIQAGSLPGLDTSTPYQASCPDDVSELPYSICHYDYRYTFRKIGTDFCGLPPSFDEMQYFATLSDADKMVALHAKLDECLDTEFWLGKDGQLWQLAHRKVRPVGSLLGFANFFDDYAFFTYTQIDDHSVRDVLVGQYLVERVDVGAFFSPEGDILLPKSEYRVVESLDDQPLQPERRAGMVTMAWPLFYNTMFTAIPRGTAAQAYRAFLGLDIAQSEGLQPVSGEPFDYDNAGVTATECAACHSTLDPLSYPFSRYNGLQGDAENGVYTYDPLRMSKYFAYSNPNLANVPEQGYIFGTPVDDLLEWAEVASESDQFFIATVSDYWKLPMGAEPSSDSADQWLEFTELWQDLKQHDSVEKMLHGFIETEAYGAP